MSNVVYDESSVRFDFLNFVSESKEGNEKIKTCIQCGSCSASCVAAEGMTLSPRKLWRSVQMGLENDVMDSMGFWNCTTCGLCDKRCPRGIPMSRIMLALREKYSNAGGNNAGGNNAGGNIAGGNIAGVMQTLANLQKSRNITGDDPGNRFLWIDNLALPEKDRD